MQPFILHGALPLGILYNSELKMGPEKTIWFGAKTGGTLYFLACNVHLGECPAALQI